MALVFTKVYERRITLYSYILTIPLWQATNLFSLNKCFCCLCFEGLSLAAGCVLYSLGWDDNPDIAQACGAEATFFYPGKWKWFVYTNWNGDITSVNGCTINLECVCGILLNVHKLCAVDFLNTWL